MLEHYKTILPGAAERLLRLYEEESRRTYRIRSAGLWLAAAAMSAAYGLTLYALIVQAFVTAGIIGGSTAAAIVTAFLRHSRQE